MALQQWFIGDNVDCHKKQQVSLLNCVVLKAKKLAHKRQIAQDRNFCVRFNLIFFNQSSNGNGLAALDTDLRPGLTR